MPGGGSSTKSGGGGTSSSPLPHTVAPTSSRPLRPSRYVPVSAATFFLRFSVAVPIYNGVIFLFVLANFCMATFMDPGIFPRAEEDEDKEDDFRAPLYKTVEIRGIQVRMKWCSNLPLLPAPPLLPLLRLRQLCGVMCVAGLFFIPVAGLTGFHIVLVARGRTTNEQVTGKFRGGVNPFTNGCWNNISHVLCSSLAPRYLGRKRRGQSVAVQPPFLRSQLTEAQLAAKILDNGIQGELHRSKSSLEMMESQSCDTEPPPPPKPELRYPGLARANTEESSLLNKAPPTPTMYKYRPSYSPGKNHTALTHAYANQLERRRRTPNAAGVAVCRGASGGRQLALRQRGNPGYSLGGRSYPSFSDPAVLSGGGGSRSSSSTHTPASATHASEANTNTSASYKSLANQTPPPHYPSRNGSLSYDNLLAGGDELVGAGTAGRPEAGRPWTPATGGYSSPFLSAQQREVEVHSSSATLLSSQSPHHHHHHHHHRSTHQHHYQQQPHLHRSSSSSSSPPPPPERERLLGDTAHSHAHLAHDLSATTPPHHHHHHHHHQQQQQQQHHHHSSSSHHHQQPPNHHHASVSRQPPRFPAPQHYPYRTRSTDTPLGPASTLSHSPHPPPLGKSLSYSSAAAAEMQYRLVRKASASAAGNAAGVGSGGNQVSKDEPFQMKALNRTNGGHTISVSAPCSAPSSPSHPISMSTRPRAAYPGPGSTQSPAHKPQAGAVKKVTGVGGTTYEISV
ncbi:hypothetical protein CRUP_026501 [Coryphaenoides rupestris]|nr:hypothetical protein CRUP_026501 [Coryphaenoides rupestris]